MHFDRDLESIQAVRDCVQRAKVAQKKLEKLTQEQIDAICEEVAHAVAQEAKNLAELAVEETGFGIVEDKVLKNLLGSTMCWDYIRSMKTVGIIQDDPGRKIMEIGTPVGVVAGILPSTNPTSTTVYKALISLKAGNAIVMSPHPGAVRCISATVDIIKEAVRRTGGPADAVETLTIVTHQAVKELMNHPEIGVILATGGEAMVRASYSSGNPAIGVGPGNGPAFIERSANIMHAISSIFTSKTFDNGTICASEQSIVTEECIAQEVEAEARREGGHFLTESESRALASILMRANGSMNPQVVGKNAAHIAKMANIEIPTGTRVLISKQTSVGHDNPYSREKLCPVLAFYVEKDWASACNRCIELLTNEGLGHTMTIHSKDNRIIREFALQKPVSRLLVNTPAALGGVGATTDLAPAMTLGCGSVGKSSTSDNITPLNLINIRRVAYGTRELEDLKSQTRGRGQPASDSSRQKHPSRTASSSEIERITQAVLASLERQRQG